MSHSIYRGARGLLAGSIVGTSRRMAVVVVLAAAIGISGPVSAYALTITFDDTSATAPVSFADVVPGGEFGPSLTFGPVTLEGGVIGLAITPSDLAATSLPNFYATSDFLAMSDGSFLAGEISATLASPVTSIVLDVGNGNVFPADFTLTAFLGEGIVGLDMITLDAFAAGPGFVGRLEVAASEITSFSVTSNQPIGSKLFVIDSVTLMLVPEPSTGTLVFVGLGFLGFHKKREIHRNQGPMRNARPQSRWVCVAS